MSKFEEVEDSEDISSVLIGKRSDEDRNFEKTGEEEECSLGTSSS